MALSRATSYFGPRFATFAVGGFGAYRPAIHPVPPVVNRPRYLSSLKLLQDSPREVARTIRVNSQLRSHLLEKLRLLSKSQRRSYSNGNPNPESERASIEGDVARTENGNNFVDSETSKTLWNLLVACLGLGAAAVLFSLLLNSDAQESAPEGSISKSEEPSPTAAPVEAPVEPPKEVPKPVDPEFNEDEMYRLPRLRFLAAAKFVSRAKIVQEKLHFDPKGWEQVYNHGNVKAWKKLDKGCTVYQYRMEGTINAPADVFYSLYTDLHHWKRWDENVDHLDVLGKDDSGKVESVYWSVKYPYPFSYRDYVFKRYSSFLEGQGVYVIFQKTTDQIPLKEKPKIVRVDNYQSIVCLKETEDGKTHVIIDSVDDPKMTLPGWVFNWLTTHGMKKFLDTLEKEAQKYSRHSHSQSSTIAAKPEAQSVATPTPPPNPVSSEVPNAKTSPTPSVTSSSEKSQTSSPVNQAAPPVEKIQSSSVAHLPSHTNVNVNHATY